MFITAYHGEVIKYYDIVDGVPTEITETEYLERIGIADVCEVVITLTDKATISGCFGETKDSVGLIHSEYDAVENLTLYVKTGTALNFSTDAAFEGYTTSGDIETESYGTNTVSFLINGNGTITI